MRVAGSIPTRNKYLSGQQGIDVPGMVVCTINFIEIHKVTFINKKRITKKKTMNSESLIKTETH